MYTCTSSLLRLLVNLTGRVPAEGGTAVWVGAAGPEVVKMEVTMVVVRMVDTLPDAELTGVLGAEAELMGMVGTLLPQVFDSVGISVVDVGESEDAALSVDVEASEVVALAVAVDSTLVTKVVRVTGTDVLWNGGSVL